MKIRTLVAAIVIALPGLAGAGECEADLDRVDGVLAGPAPLAMDDMAMVQRLRTEAGDLARDGRDLDCVNTITEAMLMLGMEISD